jgi:hypothetical protein
MKQALQSLIDEMEYVLSCINEEKIPFDGDDFHEALRLGKEALANQEQGELVALETIYETIIHWDEGGGKRSRRELARRIEALYTTPQQRKPLTDEQLDDIYYCVEGGKTALETWREQARAIEAAHGIKE